MCVVMCRLTSKDLENSLPHTFKIEIELIFIFFVEFKKFGISYLGVLYRMDHRATAGFFGKKNKWYKTHFASLRNYEFL